MRKHVLAALAACGLALVAPGARAEIDGHAPDAWRVTGVAENDVLNMRMGPGTQYMVTEHLAPDARGLELITCVPLLIAPMAYTLTDAQRAALPPRWCLMRTSDLNKAGWVAQRFLMEDGLAAVAPGAVTGISGALVTMGDPMIDGAAALVRDLYAAFEGLDSQSGNPFAAANAQRYFFAGIVPDVQGRGADLLYDAQDFQGAITRIAPDPDQPMLRSMITVNVDFTNFGTPNRAIFSLRPDVDQQGAPVRIFRIEHGGWAFPG